MTMAAEIDPRLKAIMDKLNKTPDQEEDYQQDEKPESPRAPTTFEEFVNAENLVCMCVCVCYTVYPYDSMSIHTRQVRTTIFVSSNSIWTIPLMF